MFSQSVTDVVWDNEYRFRILYYIYGKNLPTNSFRSFILPLIKSLVSTNLELLYLLLEITLTGRLLRCKVIIHSNLFYLITLVYI